MLKVLYDSSTSAAGATAIESYDNNLFDDDDDESLHSLSKGDALDAIGLRGEVSLSWADLLRKMKAEMNDMKFNQVPTLTSSKKLNVNEDFTLIPQSFNRSKGKTRSLLIGCNYNGKCRLKASHDDIRSMKVSLSERVRSMSLEVSDFLCYRIISLLSMDFRRILKT